MRMLKTRPALYKVVGQQNNHLWLEVLEGGDQGMRVSVPVRDSQYTDDLQAQVRRLSVGDVGEFVLESESENRPKWRVHEIRELEGKTDSIIA